MTTSAKVDEAGRVLGFTVPGERVGVGEKRVRGLRRARPLLLRGLKLFSLTTLLAMLCSTLATELSLEKRREVAISEMPLYLLL